jgi:predicted helicase
MASELPAFFDSLAERIDVHPGDQLLLQHHSIVCCRDLAFRLNTEKKLDEFLEDVIFKFDAELNEDGKTIDVADAHRDEEFRAFSRNSRCGTLRRL